VGRYKILAELGRGGMGIVYRATDTELGRTVAVKTLRLSEYATPQEVAGLRERLVREARAAGHLNHPNIVAVHDIGQEGDTAYIVMEFVDGRNLDDMLAESAPLGVDLALRILADAARALDHAHARGIVHRDVKPANIMVQADGGVKIADFGIAKLAWTKTMTGTGMIAGSPHYMAPEQLKGEPVSAKTDQFALAGVAYTLLTGRKPFDADTVASLFAKILNANPVPVETFTPGMDPGVGRVLQKAMAKKPADRFASCAEFVEALKSARYGAAAGAPKEKTRRSRLAIAIAALVLALVAAGGFLLYQRRQAPQAGREARKTLASAEAAKARPESAETAKLGPEKERKAPAAEAAAGKGQEKKSVAVTPSAKPVKAEVKTNPADGLAYVKIPPGTYQMGCSPGDDECDDNEKPAHPAAVSEAFWMGQTEVTVAAYQRFIQATGHQMPPGPRMNYEFKAQDPMFKMKRDDAEAYCKWAGGRLPSEVEWEWAARAGAKGPFHGNPDDIAWHEDSGSALPHPVARKAPNAFGLYDMLGNAREWCRDELLPYTATGEPGRSRGSIYGPDSVARGGSVQNRKRYIRVSVRYVGGTGGSSRISDGGFRCVLPAP
jgi:serine/threonine-protein kinase